VLDLDHVGAEVGEVAGAQRRRDRVLEAHDPQVAQGQAVSVHGARS
jgi:hypothetical protein